MKYIGEAFQGRAAYMSVDAVVGGNPGPSLADLKAELAHALAKALTSSGGRDDTLGGLGCVSAFEGWEARLRDAVVAVHGQWAEQRALSEQTKFSGVKGSEVSVVHEVLIGDAAFPTDVWVARCGWRFGAVRHERCRGDRITCSKCSGRLRSQLPAGGSRAATGSVASVSAGERASSPP